MSFHFSSGRFRLSRCIKCCSVLQPVSNERIFIEIEYFHLIVLAVIIVTYGIPVLPNGLPSRYHVSGVIQLPYAEINEPFETWIDVNLGFSRIDYYGGE